MARRALRSFSKGGLKAMESFATHYVDAPLFGAGRLHFTYPLFRPEEQDAGECE
jgi:hypothetical protein